MAKVWSSTPEGDAEVLRHTIAIMQTRLQVSFMRDVIVRFLERWARQIEQDVDD